MSIDIDTIQPILSMFANLTQVLSLNASPFPHPSRDDDQNSTILND